MNWEQEPLGIKLATFTRGRKIRPVGVLVTMRTCPNEWQEVNDWSLFDINNAVDWVFRWYTRPRTNVLKTIMHTMATQQGEWFGDPSHGVPYFP